MGQRAPVRSLHAATVEAIAKWIVGGRYASGSLLPNEADIGDELQVSRTVVREAVRTLVAKGMLATRRRLGTEVTQQAHWSLFDRDVLSWRMRFNPTAEFVRDLYEFRMTVELHAVGRCATDPKFDRNRLLEQLALLEDAATRSTDDWITADIEFHRFILLGSNNQFFNYIEPILDAVFRLLISRSKANPDVVQEVLPAHRRVAEAIAASDVAAAREAMQSIIRSGHASIATLIATWPQGAAEPNHPAPVRQGQRASFN